MSDLDDLSRLSRVQLALRPCLDIAQVSMRMFVGALVAAASLWPAALSSQTADEMRIRIAHLANAYETLVAARDSADSVRRSAVQADTLRVGLLNLICTNTHSRIVRAGGQAAWDTIRAMLGTDTVALIGTTMIVDSYDDRSLLSSMRGTEAISFGFWPHDTAGITETIISGTEKLLLNRVEGKRPWFGGRLDFSADERQRLEFAYMELATSPFSSVRDCYQGDHRACATALGITQPADTLHGWYNSNDRRKAADRLWSRWRPPPEGMWECTEGNDDDMCVSLIRRRWRDIPPPLTAAARRTIANIATDLGGEGAFQRLLQPATGSMEEILQDVSHLPSDSLLSVWRSSVLAARPADAKVPRQLGWTAFFWIFAFLALATRSSRWR